MHNAIVIKLDCFLQLFVIEVLGLSKWIVSKCLFAAFLVGTATNMTLISDSNIKHSVEPISYFKWVVGAWLI